MHLVLSLKSHLLESRIYSCKVLGSVSIIGNHFWRLEFGLYQVNPWLAYCFLAGQATRDRLREELQAVRGELTGVRQAAEADHAAIYEKERLARQHFEERRQGAPR